MGVSTISGTLSGRAVTSSFPKVKIPSGEAYFPNFGPVLRCILRLIRTALIAELAIRLAPSEPSSMAKSTTISAFVA